MFKYIRLIIRYWFCSTIHYLGNEIYSGARLQVLATGWVSPTVLGRSLEGKTHVDKYEQYQSFSVNYRQYCHFRFDIFALIIEILLLGWVSGYKTDWWNLKPQCSRNHGKPGHRLVWVEIILVISGQIEFSDCWFIFSENSVLCLELAIFIALTVF